MSKNDVIIVVVIPVLFTKQCKHCYKEMDTEYSSVPI